MNSNGKPLTDDVSNLLYRKAQEMYHDKKKRLRLRNRICQGTLITELKYASMGMLSGLQFTAEVVLSTGETTITFLVRSVDLDEEAGEWHTGSAADLEKIIAQDAMEEAPPRSQMN